MYSVGEDTGNKRLEVRIGHEAAPDPVVGRGEPADGGREQHTTRTKDSARLAECRGPVGGVDEVVQRSE